MEIHRLHEMLTAAGIEHEWRDRSLTRKGETLFPPPGGLEWGWQVIVYRADGERLVSAIEGFGTYGYMNYFGDEPGDYIEIMGLLTPEEYEDDSVKGWLTAEDVFGRITRALEGEVNE